MSNFSHYSGRLQEFFETLVYDHSTPDIHQWMMIPRNVVLLTCSTFTLFMLLLEDLNKMTFVFWIFRDNLLTFTHSVTLLISVYYDTSRSLVYACVMLLWVYIHTGQAWKICLATVGIEPMTFGIPLGWYSKGCRFDSHGGQAYFSSLPGVDIHQHSKYH